MTSETIESDMQDDLSLLASPDSGPGEWVPPPTLLLSETQDELRLGAPLGFSAGRAIYAAESVLRPTSVVEFVWGSLAPDVVRDQTRNRFAVDLQRGAEGGPSAALVTVLPARLPGHHQHFELIRFVGAGGMGQVWQAESLEYPKIPLAIKFFTHPIYSESVQLFEQCLREARLGILIESPHVVRTYLALDLRPFDAGHGCPFSEGWPTLAVVMRFLGPSLGDVLDDLHRTNTRLSLKITAKIARQLRDALDALHDRHHVVHRDIKPSNILFCFSDDEFYRGPKSLDGATVQLSDLGTACQIGEQPLLLLRQDGWKAPELFLREDRGEPDCEREAACEEDLFGFGKVLGRLVSQSETEPQELFKLYNSYADGLTKKTPRDRIRSHKRYRDLLENISAEAGSWNQEKSRMSMRDVIARYKRGELMSVDEFFDRYKRGELLR